MIQKALAFQPKEEINVRLKRDGTDLQPFPFPRCCLPAVGDRVILDGVASVCVARLIEMRDQTATLTIELRTDVG